MFDIVIVDEAHHTPAKTYSEVVQHFQPKLLIGLTATPERSDNQDVLNYFGGVDGHIGKYDLAWALKHNKLAFPKYVVLLDDLNQERLNQLQNGLTVSDLDQTLFLHKKDEEVISIIEKTVRQKEIENLKGIVFCRSIRHMRHLIQFFEMGSATLVHSKMTDQERRTNIRNFREGAFKYILVCDLFNEGIDIPETNLLVFLRYTGSRTIWLQQLGRGLRKTPNKEYVHVLDFVGSLERLNEVHQLQKAVKKVRLSVEDWESSPTEEDSEMIHDSTLEVTYTQSAAQVLKLIEELEYRLNSRVILIERLQDFIENNGRVPSIGEIEVVLSNVTCDQVSTYFDSYFRYVEAAAPLHIDKQASSRRLANYVQDYVSKFKVAPSTKAICNAFKHKSLNEFIEQDVVALIGDVGELFEVCFHDNDTSQAAEVECSHIEALSEDLEVNTERIVNKYTGVIATVHDMKTLSPEERAEIKRYFRSDFYFLKILKEAADI